MLSTLEKNHQGATGMHPLRHTAVKSAVAALLALLGGGAAAQDQPAQAAKHEHHVHAQQGRELDFDLPAQPLADALISFAQQVPGKPELTFDPAQVAGKQAPAVKGRHHPHAVLEMLLAGSGLKVLHAGNRAATIGLADAASATDTGAAQARNPVATAHEDSKALPLVTVIGTSLATDVQLYPGSISVVSQEELDRTNTLVDALAKIPGVATGGNAGRTHGQTFMIRGFGGNGSGEERVIVMQNGVRRSTSLYSGMISSTRTDNDLLKHVEVIKGASSVQHGSGAIGGVIAMETKEARDFLPEGKELGGAAKLRYEHNNYREGYAALAFAPKDRPIELLAYGKKGRTGDLKQSRAVSGIINSDGYVDNHEDLGVLYLEGVVKPGPGQRLSLSLYDYKLDTVTTWQTIGNYDYLTPEDGGPVSGKLNQRDVVARYRFTPADNPWIDLSAQLYHSGANYDRGYDYTNNPKALKLDYDNSEKRYGLRLGNESHFQTGSVSHRLALGLSYEQRKEDAHYVLDGVPTVFGSMPNTYKDTGLYGHLESSMLSDRLKLQLGGRYDSFDRSVNGKDSNFKGNHFSPRVGASFEVFNGFNLLGNWSEAFRAPTPHETASEGPLNRMYWYVPNPNLKPETARETEIGASWTRNGVLASGDMLRSKLMYFNGRVKDMIVVVGTRPGEVPPGGFSRAYGTYANVDSVKRHGLELQTDYTRDGTGLGLSYSTLRQTDEATGRPTPRTFADTLSLRGHFTPMHGLRLGADLTHWFKPQQNPETTTTTVNGKPTTVWYVRDSYTIVNIYAQWQPRPADTGLFGRDMVLRMGVNNLFNASYLAANSVEYTPLTGKGRNIYLQMETRF